MRVDCRRARRCYDSDFYIYNDVTIVHHDAKVDHYPYHETVFPPTDSHTATLIDDHILIIGSLGYQGRRPEGETQVLRFDLSGFSVSKRATSGENPGWISRHKAVLKDGNIVVTGGKVEPDYANNNDTFVLNVSTMVRSRTA